MIKSDIYYKEFLKKILEEGTKDENPRPKYKDGTPAYTLFITQTFEEYDISKDEFPIPTVRNTAIKTGIKEILWIYQQQSNSLNKANELGISWWDEFDIGDRTIGNRYGYTVKNHNLIDNLLKSLETDLYSRRHILNLYQESDLKSSAGLYPCCYETLWSYDGKLNCHLNIRSNDFIMAGFINRIQYVALQMMIAGHLGLEVGKFTVFTNNLHIYDRHIPAACEILERKPKSVQPLIILSKNKNFYDYTIDDFMIENNLGEKINCNLELAI